MKFVIAALSLLVLAEMGVPWWAAGLLLIVALNAMMLIHIINILQALVGVVNAFYEDFVPQAPHLRAVDGEEPPGA